MNTIPRPHWKVPTPPKPWWQRLVLGFFEALSMFGGGQALGITQLPKIIRPLYYRMRMNNVATAATTAEKTGATSDAISSIIPEGRSYTVVTGDSLWKIAKDSYGRGERWIDIWRLNRGQITEANLIFPGQVFTIPGIELHRENGVRPGVSVKDVTPQTQTAKDAKVPQTLKETDTSKTAGMVTQAAATGAASKDTQALKNNIQPKIDALARSLNQLKNSVDQYAKDTQDKKLAEAKTEASKHITAYAAEAKKFTTAVASASSKTATIDAVVNLLDVARDTTATVSQIAQVDRSASTMSSYPGGVYQTSTGAPMVLTQSTPAPSPTSSSSSASQTNAENRISAPGGSTDFDERTGLYRSTGTEYPPTAVGASAPATPAPSSAPSVSSIADKTGRQWTGADTVMPDGSIAVHAPGSAPEYPLGYVPPPSDSHGEVGAQGPTVAPAGIKLETLPSGYAWRFYPGNPTAQPDVAYPTGSAPYSIPTGYQVTHQYETTPTQDIVGPSGDSWIFNTETGALHPNRIASASPAAVVVPAVAVAMQAAVLSQAVGEQVGTAGAEQTSNIAVQIHATAQTIRDDAILQGNSALLDSSKAPDAAISAATAAANTKGAIAGGDMNQAVANARITVALAIAANAADPGSAAALTATEAASAAVQSLSSTDPAAVNKALAVYQENSSAPSTVGATGAPSGTSLTESNPQAAAAFGSFLSSPLGMLTIAVAPSLIGVMLTITKADITDNLTRAGLNPATGLAFGQQVGEITLTPQDVSMINAMNDPADNPNESSNIGPLGNLGNIGVTSSGLQGIDAAAASALGSGIGIGGAGAIGYSGTIASVANALGITQASLIGQLAQAGKITSEQAGRLMGQVDEDTPAPTPAPIGEIDESSLATGVAPTGPPGVGPPGIGETNAPPDGPDATGGPTSPDAGQTGMDATGVASGSPAADGGGGTSGGPSSSGPSSGGGSGGEAP